MTTEPTAEPVAAIEPVAEIAPPAVTTATDWRKSAEGLYRLPGSGNVARLRRLSLITLAAAGGVPNPLSQDVLRYLASKGDQRLNEAEQIAEYKRNAKAFIEIAARCLVEPRLWVPPAETARGKGEPAKTAPDYEAGEIGVEDLADNDYTWIFFSFVGGDAAWRETFRVG